jgi:predicted DNA-binding transcriptional regulator YafY
VAAAARLGEADTAHPERRRFRVRRRDAFARWLLSFAGDIVPVYPDEMVEEFRTLLRETLAHHAADRPTARPSDRPS